eukprot:13758185-Alexandrium_andersonii.AAC.1
MSASLVGSEMCIRDRPKPGGSSPDSILPRRTPGSPDRAPASAASRESVSYTHLTLPTICSV